MAPFFVGPLVQQLLERRAKLNTYLLHSSAVRVHPPNADPIIVHLHAIVIRNDGKKPALNVRVGHNVLPDYSVFPDVQHSVLDLPGGGKEILFPALIPGEQLTIQYLYFPPMLYNQINTPPRSDEGYARFPNVLPTPQLSKPIMYLFRGLLFVGVVTIVYLFLLLITFAAHKHNQLVNQVLPVVQGTAGATSQK